MSPYYLEKREEVVTKLSRVYIILLKESVSAFVRLKEKHGELEKLYSGYMDFDRINELTEQVMKKVI